MHLSQKNFVIKWCLRSHGILQEIFVWYLATLVNPDDVIKLKNFPCYRSFVRWIHPPVTGGFPSQRSVTRNFNVFIHLRLNKRLSKQWRHRWFETPSRLLWHHCNVALPVERIFEIKSIVIDLLHFTLYVTLSLSGTEFIAGMGREIPLIYMYNRVCNTVH